MKRSIPGVFIFLSCAASVFAAQDGGENESDRALKQVVADVRSAKAPEELDSILTRLSQLGSGVGNLINARDDLQPAVELVRQWQDYLSDIQAGRDQGARQVLTSIARSDSAVRFIPRSRVLALLNASEENTPQPSMDAAVEEILRAIKTPDDLGSALGRLTKLKQGSQALGKFGRADPATAIETLSPLEKAYRDLQAGLAVRIEILLASSDLYPPFQGIIAPVRADLIDLALPKYLGLPEEETAKPGEGPYRFLSRLAAGALQQGDYLLVAKAREAQQLLRDGAAYRGPERSQAGLFVSARNFEGAGQFALAVANYERALASPQDTIPPELIGERLNAIESAHPAEFLSGMESSSSPAPPYHALPAGSAAARGAVHPPLTVHASALSQPQTPAPPPQ